MVYTMYSVHIFGPDCLISNINAFNILIIKEKLTNNDDVQPFSYSHHVASYVHLVLASCESVGHTHCISHALAHCNTFDKHMLTHNLSMSNTMKTYKIRQLCNSH